MERPLRILVVQLEGLGNAVLTTPLIAALASLGNIVSVLYDPSRSSGIAFENWPWIHQLITPSTPKARLPQFDVELWCHPKWQHKMITNCADRRFTPVAHLPGDWMKRFEKHEVQYMMELAYALGYKEDIPGLRVHHKTPVSTSKRVAVGIGYLKKGTNQAWAKKHWGNDNYRHLVRLLCDLGRTPVLIGDRRDYEQDGRHIWIQGVENACFKPLPQIVDAIAGCEAYIGNDTGLMHVAAALGKPCLSLFLNSSVVKNHPWGVEWVALEGQTDPVTVVNHFAALVGSK